MTSVKGTRRVTISQTSIILISEVLGRELDTPMNRVASSRSDVRFTVTTASNRSS